MQTIIGVRFKKAGKIFYFSPGSLTIEKGDRVVTETARGIECGMVVIGPREVDESELKAPLKVVLRIANDHDIDRLAENKENEREAFEICEEKIAQHGLPMKLVEVEYTFDLSKIIFYFTADGRIDFRELVKDLAAVFRTRIELRQIGVRDEAKLMGGIGCCGRPLCCATFLGGFEPVSIRMAKDQNLSLNPTKISGICGRLMCCLKYENDCYACGMCGKKQQRTVTPPEQGGRVVAAEGEGKVISVNMQRRTATILLDNSRTIVASWEDVVMKDDEQAIAPAPAAPRFKGDEEDEADASLIAAITERSEKAERLGEDEGEEPRRPQREKRQGDRRRGERRERGDRNDRGEHQRRPHRQRDGAPERRERPERGERGERQPRQRSGEKQDAPRRERPQKRRERRPREGENRPREGERDKKND